MRNQGLAKHICHAHSPVRQVARVMDAPGGGEYDRVNSNRQVKFGGSVQLKLETTDDIEPSGEWVPKDLPAEWYDLSDSVAWFRENWLR